ncbi:MAG: cytochrome c [Bacteroidota bacterium]
MTHKFSFTIFLLCTLIFTLPNCGESEPYPQGKNLYSFHCQNCHMEDGVGLGALIPPLAGADYMAQHQDQMACIIQYGLMDTIVVNGVTYMEPMAGIEGLNNIQITNLINYINHAWGNDYGFVTVEQIDEQLKNCN